MIALCVVVAQGHTQLDFPADAEEAVWAHPVDVHYAVSDRVQGWPKFQLQVYQEDAYGRNELVGYGFVHVPSAPGVHEVQCSCWRPMSREWAHEVEAFFVGGNPQLKSEDMIANNIDRYKLRTRSSGCVTFKLQVMLKGFSKYGEYQQPSRIALVVVSLVPPGIFAAAYQELTSRAVCCAPRLPVCQGRGRVGVVYVSGARACEKPAREWRRVRASGMTGRVGPAPPDDGRR